MYNFPTTSGAFDTTWNDAIFGWQDAIVSRIDMGMPLFADVHKISIKTGEAMYEALEARGFYEPAAMRPKMVRNMRSLFARVPLTLQDVQSLHGIVKALGRAR